MCVKFICNVMFSKNTHALWKILRIESEWSEVLEAAVWSRKHTGPLVVVREIRISCGHKTNLPPRSNILSFGHQWREQDLHCRRTDGPSRPGSLSRHFTPRECAYF